MEAYTYITINMINQMMYIGAHTSKSYDKSYKGSGSYLWNAINKYGWDNFKNYIIKGFGSIEEAFEYERYLIDKYDAVNSNRFYNLRSGGLGNYTYWVIDSDNNRLLVDVSELANYQNDENYVIMNRTTSKGLIWVNDGIKNKYIYPDELEDYLSDGFSRGFLHKDNPNFCGKPGVIAIHKGSKRKFVLPDELEGYLDEGYVLGTGNHTPRGRHEVVHKGDKVHYIRPEELSDYLNNGYEPGMPEALFKMILGNDLVEVTKDHINEYLAKGYECLGTGKTGTTKGKIRITNGTDDKMIYPEELDYWISQGYHKGSSFDYSKKKSTKGMVCYTNGLHNQKCYPEEAQELIDKGYHKGMTRLNKIIENREKLLKN